LVAFVFSVLGTSGKKDSNSLAQEGLAWQLAVLCLPKPEMVKKTDNELLEMAQKWKIVGMLKLHQSAMSLKELTFFFFMHTSVSISTDEPK